VPNKHYQLIVPNYDQSGSDAEGAPLSYLRLGGPFDDSDVAEPLNTAHKRGDTLVQGLAFKDDWRTPTYPTKPYTRDDGVARTTTNTAAALTGELLSRGGVREHTDGNRISTTRGDMVEVIQGNYKLIVLGRVAKDWDPSGLGDAGNTNQVGRTRQEISSGGHYNESTSTPGEVMSITWGEQEDGTFRTLEQTDHGDVRSTFKGWKREEFYGPKIIENIGVATSAYAIEGGSGTATNVSSAGAHSAKKPDITDKTYARSMQSAMHVVEIDDKTEVSLHIMEKTHIKQAMTELETCKNKTSLGFAVFFNETLCATNHNVKDGFLEWRRNYTFGALDFGMSLVGFTLIKNKGFGISISAEQALSIDVGLSATCQTYLFTNVRIGPRLEISLGGSAEPVLFHIDSCVLKVKSALVYVHQAAVDYKARIKASRLAAVNSEGA
jgi:hypothetical protein